MQNELDTGKVLSSTKLSALGPSPLLIILLPPCVLLYALDLMIKNSISRPIESSPSEPTESHESAIALRKQETIQTTKAAVLRQVHLDIDELEQRVMRDDRRKKEARLIEKRRKFAHHRRRMAILEQQRCQGLQLVSTPTTPPSPPPHTAPNGTPESRRAELRSRVDPAFLGFCERLLLENRLWRQQRELRNVQASLSSMKKAKDSTAFQAFCDRLLLTNNVWSLQKEVDRLSHEMEKIRRSRVLAVTRAAKQMVLDVQKERMIEEYIRDLIEELTECRQTVKDLRIQQQREVEEMERVFKKEYRRMSRELERLKLAQEAKVLEQEISNDVETRLLSDLARYEKQEKSFFAEVEVEVDGDSIASEGDAASDTELEVMSNTSTCVGSAGVPSPNRKASFGTDVPPSKQLYLRRKSSLQPLNLHLDASSLSSTPYSSPSGKTPAHKMDAKAYVGFSFNPLFFGPAASGDGSPSPIRSTAGNKAFGVATPSPLGSTAVAPKRPQWRI